MVVVTYAALFVIALGWVMVVASALSNFWRVVLRIPRDHIKSDWYRKNDTSGMAMFLDVWRPGLVVIASGGALAGISVALGG